MSALVSRRHGEQRGQVDLGHRLAVLEQLDPDLLLAITEGVQTAVLIAAPEAGVVEVAAAHHYVYPLLVGLVPVVAHAQLPGQPAELVGEVDPLGHLNSSLPS